MATRRLAYHAAGALWLVLGVVAILTVFGVLIGVGLAWFVGVRRSAIAARIGAAFGLGLIVPFQLIIDVSGCGHESCGPEPFLLADGLPLAIAALSLYAGWAPGRPSSVNQPPRTAAESLPAPEAARGDPRVEAPGQLPLWDVPLVEPADDAWPPAAPDPSPGTVPLRDGAPASQALWPDALPAATFTRTVPAP